MLMAKLLRIYDPHGAKVVHCFDSFEGLTEFTVQDGDMDRNAERYKGSLEELKDIIDLYEMSDEIVIHQGLIEQTLAGVLDANEALSFSLVYCDVDLYQPTRIMLELVHPRFVKGGVFVFDEWNADWFPGKD